MRYPRWRSLAGGIGCGFRDGEVRVDFVAEFAGEGEKSW
jgi:hypothetical protein